jgi:hypothetical protein
MSNKTEIAKMNKLKGDNYEIQILQHIRNHLNIQAFLWKDAPKLFCNKSFFWGCIHRNFFCNKSFFGVAYTEIYFL